jgi:c-di-GMP-binding flagellar brake protein YcgR
MSQMAPQSIASITTGAAASFASKVPEDRRRHKRLPVTVAARVFRAEASYRTEILDVSDGGMLLAPIEAVALMEHEIIQIDSASLGRIEARVICVSRIGIHIAIAYSPQNYHAAIERLFDLTRAWTHT